MCSPSPPSPPCSPLTPGSSLTSLPEAPPTHQVHSHLRAFALAVPSAWKVLPQEVHLFTCMPPIFFNGHTEVPGPGIESKLCCRNATSFFFFWSFLGPHLQPLEVPRLGGESELQLPAYITATATQNPSRICDLHHSSQQRQILNTLNKVRDRTCILMDASQVH